MYSRAPQAIVLATNATVAAAALFLMHSAGSNEYGAIQRQEKVHTGRMVVDARSDDGSFDDDDSDQEDG
jgi:hypothetical protein